MNDIDALIEIIFETIKPNQRDGDEAINMRDLAEAIFERRAEWVSQRFDVNSAQGLGTV